MAEPLVATYSIVGCDLEARQWGVAVQSKFLAVGSVVPWAEPEVGAIATQAYANPRYGPNGLALLREGLSAAEVVERLIAEDDGRAERQLGVVDGEGRSASWTGPECLDWAGHLNGPRYAAPRLRPPPAFVRQNAGRGVAAARGRPPRGGLRAPHAPRLRQARRLGGSREPRGARRRRRCDRSCCPRSVAGGLVKVLRIDDIE